MEKNKSVGIPAKKKILQTYESYIPYLETIMKNIQLRLVDNLKLSSQPTYKKRINSFNSYYKKLLRLKPEEAVNSDSLICLTDMMGIRIICTFLEDLSEVKEQIKSLFDVKEIEIKGSSQSFKEFGYESIHVLVAIPQECFPKEDFYDEKGNKLIIPDNAVCEIQIRTILQDAWAEVEHELIYKTEFTPFDMPLKRKLASMNASLSLADIIFQEIRDYQKKLQVEMNERHRSFYERADELITNENEKVEKVEKNLEKVSPYVRGTIDDMLLEAIHAHNSQQLDRAIDIYTQIIESKPTPNNIVLSVIHKHRGMAYFAKNDLSSALNDFHSSYELDKSSFRSVYYEGIVYSIQKNFEKSIECFTMSLELNEYQSHTYYRRALSYYELGEYEKSMNDVIAAQKLGLLESECKNLHDKLIEKFDMKM